MKTTWIVLANAARARIFEARERDTPPVEIHSLVHGASRMKGGELRLDRGGHTELHGSDTGQGGAAYQPKTDARDKEHTAFAREIAQLLHKGVSSRACERVLLAASAPFLGELRAALDPAVAQVVADSVASDLTGLETLPLRERLAQMLAPRAS